MNSNPYRVSRVIAASDYGRDSALAAGPPRAPGRTVVPVEGVAVRAGDPPGPYPRTTRVPGQGGDQRAPDSHVTVVEPPEAPLAALGRHTGNNHQHKDNLGGSLHTAELGLF